MIAFEQLLAEGFLEGRTGSGTYVSDRLPEEIYASASSQKEIKDSKSIPALSQASELLIKQRSPVFLEGRGAFRASISALDLFPWSVWSRITSDCVRRQTAQQLGYSSPLGLKAFREAIASYLRTARNLRCEVEQIIVVSGSQQALSLAARVLLNTGDSVWVEEPGYSGARDAFLLNGTKLCPVSVDAAGLMVNDGREKFPTARLAYVTPSHQYPLEVTVSLKRRLELLEWALTHSQKNGQ